MSRAERRRQQKKAENTAKTMGTVRPTGVPPTHQPPSVQKILGLAVQHHMSGRLDQAETLYQQILKIDPNQAAAMPMLGLIAKQAGNQLR